jgi:primosomal protein N'
MKKIEHDLECLQCGHRFISSMPIHCVKCRHKYLIDWGFRKEEKDG